MKGWFNKEKGNWGKGSCKLFNRWKKDNQASVDKLCEELTKKIDQVKP